MQDRANWTQQRERGSVSAIRAVVWLALHLGRPTMRALLFPICLYFLLVPSHWQRASRDFLPRALGRKASFRDGWRHCHCFARCLLDRVYLLNGQTDRFDVRLLGCEVIDRLRGNGGLLLFGAHLGSFEVTRAVGHATADAPISIRLTDLGGRRIETAAGTSEKLGTESYRTKLSFSSAHTGALIYRISFPEGRSTSGSVMLNDRR